MGIFNWVTHMIQSSYSGSVHTYTDALDTEEDDEDVQEYQTIIVPGTPLRATKCVFVPEINDFYSDA